MKCEEDRSPSFADSIHLHNTPYSFSLATSASVSSTSVWSDASSQNSDDTSITAPTSDPFSYDPCGLSGQQISSQTSATACEAVKVTNSNSGAIQTTLSQVDPPPELRQNPRRTTTSLTSRSGCPPTLVRQTDRKVNFVDNLVGKKTI